MLLQYVFNEQEVAVLDKARHVFNRFTGQDYDLNQYIQFAVQTAIAYEVETARLCGAEMDKPVTLVTKQGVRHVYS